MAELTFHQLFTPLRPSGGTFLACASFDIQKRMSLLMSVSWLTEFLKFETVFRKVESRIRYFLVHRTLLDSCTIVSDKGGWYRYPTVYYRDFFPKRFLRWLWEKKYFFTADGKTDDKTFDISSLSPWQNNYVWLSWLFVKSFCTFSWELWGCIKTFT